MIEDDETRRRFDEVIDETFGVPVEGGVAFYQMFRSWVTGGFTEDQALTLMAKWIAEMGRRSVREESE